MRIALFLFGGPPINRWGGGCPWAQRIRERISPALLLLWEKRLFPFPHPPFIRGTGRKISNLHPNGGWTENSDVRDDGPTSTGRDPPCPMPGSALRRRPSQRHARGARISPTLATSWDGGPLASGHDRRWCVRRYAGTQAQIVSAAVREFRLKPDGDGVGRSARPRRGRTGGPSGGEGGGGGGGRVHAYAIHRGPGKRQNGP